MTIQGSLSEMSLAMLVQIACTQGQRARLVVRKADQSADIYFDAGNLVHATLGDRVGEEVVYRVMKWVDGEFSLESSVASPAVTINTPWSALLVDALQRHDEETWDGSENHKEVYEMPENIQDILLELEGQVAGFIATSVVGMDGLGIADHASAAGVDIDMINAQMTLLIKLVDTTVSRLMNDNVDDYLLTTKDAYLLIRFLEGNEHYLGIAASRHSGKLGNLRLTSQLFAKRVQKAMPR